MRPANIFIDNSHGYVGEHGRIRQTLAERRGQFNSPTENLNAITFVNEERLRR